MKLLLKPHAIGLFFGLLLLCSCVSRPRSATIIPAGDLPVDTAINQDASSNDMWIVTIRLDDGEMLPLLVDTGSPEIMLDQSLEPKLGKRLEVESAWTLNTSQFDDFNIYASPRMYLGRTPLMTGDKVATGDFKSFFDGTGRPVMGILGMDCLKHYCIQLDFAAGKMRFLNPWPLDVTGLGRSFPLAYSSRGQSEQELFRPCIHAGSLIGNKGAELLIDTGCDTDGCLKPELFRREVHKHAEGLLFTNQAVGDPESLHIQTCFQECVWQGETCTNLIIQQLPDRTTNAPNSVGLRFLMRHLITFDFPERRLYLKQTSRGPIAEDGYSKYEVAAGATDFFEDLLRSGRAPGWSRWVHGNFDFSIHTERDFSTCELRKNHDPLTYHYQISRKPAESGWKLMKAWSTDQNGKIIKNYPVPQTSQGSES